MLHDVEVLVDSIISVKDEKFIDLVTFEACDRDKLEGDIEYLENPRFVNKDCYVDVRVAGLAEEFLSKYNSLGHYLDVVSSDTNLSVQPVLVSSSDFEAGKSLSSGFTRDISFVESSSEKQQSFNDFFESKYGQFISSDDEFKLE